MQEVKGSMTEFKAEQAKSYGYLALSKTSRGGVLVLHAWWGLNDFFKKLCNRLAAEGYTAFAPDLNAGKIALTVEEAKELMSTRDEEANSKVSLSAVDYLLAQPSVHTRRLAVIGFSMGAAYALWLSTERPSDVAGVVTFYGTNSVDFSKSRASYLGHYSPEDEWEPIGDIRSLEQKIRAEGRPVEFHFYPGTKHWFFEDDRPEFDKEKSHSAWTRTLEFLQTTLKKTDQ